MTKQELITELWNNGEVWANHAYTKAQLEAAVEGMKKAKTMTLEELEAKVKGHKEDTDMTDSKKVTFEINGTTYNSNDKGNRFYSSLGWW